MIAGLEDRKPRALSRGQRQRVAQGRAIMRNPQCFLFGEPLSNLDAKLRVGMRAKIKQPHLRLGSTTVYVTHDQEEAMTLGDRVVVMQDGVVQQIGSALEIYHLPTNQFVAGFLGQSAGELLARQAARGWGADLRRREREAAGAPWARAMLAGARRGDKGQEVVPGIRWRRPGARGGLPACARAARSRSTSSGRIAA